MSRKNYNTDSKSIVIAVHHFPPNFKGGAEWRAHRTAKWLQEQGHSVQVICVESVSDSTTSNLRWVDDTFDGLSVRRLYLNLNNAPNRARREYDNPWITEHLTGFLPQLKPDIFHLISGYLMTAGAIKAAKSLGIPVVATLTDFWFLCPRHTLRRTSGDICTANTALDCARCKFEEKRRYRLPAQKAPQLANLLWRGLRAAPPVSETTAEMTRRADVLKTTLASVDVA
ncbi:MAG: glycosyl transferase family 1, partial [Chloroflexi bacterium]